MIFTESAKRDEILIGLRSNLCLHFDDDDGDALTAYDVYDLGFDESTRKIAQTKFGLETITNTMGLLLLLLLIIIIYFFLHEVSLLR